MRPQPLAARAPHPPLGVERLQDHLVAGRGLDPVDEELGVERHRQLSALVLGRTAARPTLPTCWRCASSTTACTTGAGWASPATPTTPTGWSSPTSAGGPWSPAAGPCHRGIDHGRAATGCTRPASGSTRPGCTSTNGIAGPSRRSPCPPDGGSTRPVRHSGTGPHAAGTASVVGRYGAVLRVICGPREPASVPYRHHWGAVGPTLAASYGTRGRGRLRALSLAFGPRTPRAGSGVCCRSPVRADHTSGSVRSSAGGRPDALIRRVTATPASHQLS